MEKLTLKELAIPMIKAIDSFNYLLKSHHRRVAIISYNIGKALDLENEALLELVIAASLHDIGALSVQERDMLVQEDVTNPKPHCIMGYKMLHDFDIFTDVAQTIKHHHIKYEDSLSSIDTLDIPFKSHIIHLADRIDILINPEEFILNQKTIVSEKIKEKVGTTFHPDVFAAFEKASKADIFWIEIHNMSMDQLFRKMNFSLSYEMSIDSLLAFSLTISHIVDFRSRFTVTHSYTVGNLAALLGTYFDFSEEKCKKLKVAGYLHDIGKIGIDPGLIEKNGKLTEEEYNLMRLHPYYTGQILNELSQSEWFLEIVDWAEKHHEKSDGSGYPYAVDDSQLNEGHKILAFADIITAIMENRPYRGPTDIDKAFEIIEQYEASKISNDMFEVLKQHKDEINSLVKECQEHNYG